jgi:hypothetical protein
MLEGKKHSFSMSKEVLREIFDLNRRTEKRILRILLGVKRGSTIVINIIRAIAGRRIKLTGTFVKYGWICEVRVNTKRRKVNERDRLELDSRNAFIIFKCALKLYSVKTWI